MGDDPWCDQHGQVEHPHLEAFPGGGVIDVGDPLPDRPAARQIHIDPLRFPARQQLRIRRARELVLALCAHAAHLHEPGAHLDLIALVGRRQVLNAMLAREPSRVLRKAVIVDGPPVGDRRILHPLHVDHVIHMPVLVNGAGWHAEGIDKDGRRCHSASVPLVDDIRSSRFVSRWVFGLCSTNIDSRTISFLFLLLTGYWPLKTGPPHAL